MGALSIDILFSGLEIAADVRQERREKRKRARRPSAAAADANLGAARML